MLHSNTVTLLETMYNILHKCLVIFQMLYRKLTANVYLHLQVLFQLFKPVS